MTTINENIIKQMDAILDNKDLPKEGDYINRHRNMIGALAGAAVAVGLEVVSPTGSKTSAVVAAAVSLGATYAARNIIEAAPQSNITAATVAAGTCYAGMVGGRIAACYFPGNVGE